MNKFKMATVECGKVALIQKMTSLKQVIFGLKKILLKYFFCFLYVLFYPTQHGERIVGNGSTTGGYSARSLVPLCGP